MNLRMYLERGSNIFFYFYFLKTKEVKQSLVHLKHLKKIRLDDLFKDIIIQ